MFRINKDTDYGVLLLALFARFPERATLSARELALNSGIPFPMASKILKLLARDGILCSRRGPKGGYSLSRSLSEISVAEIIDCLEGPLSLTECIEHPGDCRQEPTCRVRGNWGVINAEIRGALSRVSLLEMATPMPDQQLVPLDMPEMRQH